MKHLFLLILFALSRCGALAGDAAPTKPKTISIDMPDTAIRPAIREIADRFEINVVIPESLNGRTSIKLSDVTWEQAFTAILKPVGYSYIEEGDIIKVVAQKSTSSEPESLSWSDSPWYLIPAIALVGLVTAVCHVALFVGVLRDSAVRSHFAPRIIWALLVLIGGVLSLLAYWIIHHSRLRSTERTPNQSLQPTGASARG